ncbi:SAM-dependent DNA methyltransferase [Pseudomonas aeruginosa]|nr:SAM-dependent DNA methyltransferase [Pseudomonas aeruginosa]
MNTQIHATMNSRIPLEKTLRRALETTVIKARDVAERAAAQALERLCVGDAKAADYLTDEQKQLRNRLRAHGRQLGDIKQNNGQQSTGKLVAEVAYEHWHRMLFARFLEQNQLLMYDQHTALTLAECNELVQEPDIARDEQEARCTSGWELAGVLASKMLPQIFRIDSPVFELELAPEHQRTLEQLVTGLALETFQAQDSLGWVYQFWQSKRKEEVNKSEVKIGADELSPVTQLFTEPYMVSFLLDNSLGAWWAGQRLSETDWKQAESEQELRDRAAIPGVPLSYLRFVKDDATQQWQPASGTFDAWPKQLSELKALDPCCGSGHFLVAAFLMLVPMRMTLESLGAQEAIDRVLSENLHGLELDQRCVELAAFAVALEAWRYPGAGGYRTLPELHLACTGLSVTAAKDEWKTLAHQAGKHNLSSALDWLQHTFADAPVLGSLINPRRSQADMASWSDIQQLLKDALQQDNTGTDRDSNEHNNRQEAGIVVQGLIKAAELLAGQYTWVITNVPYKKTGEMVEEVDNFLTKNYPHARRSLETSFLSRCMEFLSPCGVSSLVLPQNWLFLNGYKDFRKVLLDTYSWKSVARLGAGAFETISGEHVKAILLTLDNQPPSVMNGTGKDNTFFIDAASERKPNEKSHYLRAQRVTLLPQYQQLKNPDFRITLGNENEGTIILADYANGIHGTNTKDAPRFIRCFWEIELTNPDWVPGQTTVEKVRDFGGLSTAYHWEQEKGELKKLSEIGKAILAGGLAWGKKGISVRQVGHLPCSQYLGSKFDQNCAAIIPSDENLLSAVWCFCSSESFKNHVRHIDQSLKVTNSTLGKVRTSP